MATLSKTQIDRLGERLKKGSPCDDDLRLLDEFRRSFGPAYESVIRTIREKLHLEPTGRPAKSTTSITEKLRRESIRLSQIQDIAGCRVIVADIVAQDRSVATMRDAFSEVRVMDRRTTPSHGYRAVHVIVMTGGASVEVQVRSSLQHLWAELSERLSDVVDSSIKYGGGDQQVNQLLSFESEWIAKLEEFEKDLSSLPDEAAQAHSSKIRQFQEGTTRMKTDLAERLRGVISKLEGKQR
jgi:ppGpp synthetase/RelA/SpoT-type nucleotidyltranferase